MLPSNKNVSVRKDALELNQAEHMRITVTIVNNRRASEEFCPLVD